MRILFVMPHVPSRERVRQREFMRHLAARGHELTLVALTRPGERLDALAEVARWCRDVTVVPVTRLAAARNCLLSLPGRAPLNVAFFASAEARRVLGRLNPSRFDLVHLDFLRTVQYAPLFDGLPRLYDANDCMTLLCSRARGQGRWRGRALAAWELWKTRRYEPWALSLMDGVVATSETDVAALRALAPRVPVRQVPNGVDADYFRPGPDLSDGRTLVFLGRMGYHANVASVLDFVGRVLPLLWERQPRTRLIIVGADPPPVVRRLANEPRIHVTGYVKDVRPYLARATIGVCPIVYGAGIQNKVLEFMAAGLPVVASPQACSGVKAEDGVHLLAADEPEEWAETLVGLLSSPARRRLLAAAGREYVVQRHSWEDATDLLEQAYEEIARPRVSLRKLALAA